MAMTATRSRSAAMVVSVICSSLAGDARRVGFGGCVHGVGACVCCGYGIVRSRARLLVCECTVDKAGEVLEDR